MVQSTYICPDLELRYGANSSSPLSNVGLNAIASTNKTYSQLLYVDHNIATNEVYFTTITDGTGLARTIKKSGLDYDGSELDSATVELWKLFDNDGNVVALNDVAINVSGSTSSICEYNYQYENNINPSFEIAIVAKESNTTDYYEFDYDDISVGFVGGTNIITINVTSKSGSYIIKINGSARNANSNFTVLATE